MESLRAQAHYFAPDRDPYEVWLDRYEHGLTIAQCDTFFAALRETIVPLLAAIKRARQRHPHRLFVSELAH